MTLSENQRIFFTSRCLLFSFFVFVFLVLVINLDCGMKKKKSDLICGRRNVEVLKQQLKDLWQEAGRLGSVPGTTGEMAKVNSHDVLCDYLMMVHLGHRVVG